MAFCSNCGHQLADGVKFCSECGARVQNVEKTPTEQRKIVYEGNLHKCPNCGEILNSYAPHCPTCGHEIREAQAVSSVRKLALQLEQLEAKRTPKKIKNIRDIISEEFSADDSLNGVDQQKIDLIRNYAIPNTKEDVIEFIVLASSNVNLQRYNDFDQIPEAEKALSDAWEAKMDQAYQKATIMFGHLPEFERVQKMYDTKRQQIHKAKLMRLVFWIGVPAAVLIVVFGLLFLVNNFI